MTDTKKLKAKIIEHGLTQSGVAEKLGISYQTFSYKVNNKTAFKANEIEALCEILKIAEKDAYFFCSAFSHSG